MITENLILIAIALLTFNAWQFLICGYFDIPMGFFPSSDIFGEKHHARMNKLSKKFFSTWTIPLLATGVFFLLSPWVSWHEIDPNNIFYPIILIISGVMTWRAVTMDVELATLTSYPKHRILIIFLWVGIWFHPGFLIPFLHTGICWLRSYYHHQHLSIRMMTMFIACLSALPMLDIINSNLGRSYNSDITAPCLFLFLCLSASTYFLSVMKKISLGPHWFSWIKDNRLHTLVMSAYLWGWVRFLPEKFVIALVKTLRPFDRVFQLYTSLVQICSVLILFNQTFCILLMHLFLVFHFMIMILSGIFFFQHIVATILILWAVINLPPEMAPILFNFETGMLAATILYFFPYKGRIWLPARLGWWDTPLSCRVHYEVRGKSKKWYGLYNDFMCPNERTFGQTCGQVFVDEKRLNTHVGECTSRKKFNAINSIKKDLSNLDELKNQFGYSKYNLDQSKILEKYLKQFFRNFNAGHKKRTIPWWLKAPGGQLFYWGVLPKFTGQEQIDKVVIRYKEYFFDGNKIHLATDYVVREYDSNDLNHPTPERK